MEMKSMIVAHLLERSIMSGTLHQMNGTFTSSV